MEKETTNKYKEDLIQLSNTLRSNFDPNNLSCIRCDHLLRKIDYGQISRVLGNNKHVKQEYDRILCPVQYLLIFVCFVNTFVIIMVFQKPLKFFLLSVSFAIGCFLVHGEFLLQDQSLLISTIILGVLIVCFSVYLSVHVVITLIVIANYQTMKGVMINVLLSEVQLDESAVFKKNVPNLQRLN